MRGMHQFQHDEKPVRLDRRQVFPAPYRHFGDSDLPRLKERPVHPPPSASPQTPRFHALSDRQPCPRAPCSIGLRPDTLRAGLTVISPKREVSRAL